MEEKIMHKDLSGQIIGAAFEVHNILGYGFLEKVYENALMHELFLRGIRAEQQKRVVVIYKEKDVGDYCTDVLVENEILLELKAEKCYNKQHEKQLLNYLKATEIKLGYLINFGEEKVKFKRFISSPKF